MQKSKPLKKESAGGLIYYDGKFLLIRDTDTGLFEIPKGGLNVNESKESACIREIKEETGYDIEIVSYLSTTRFLLDWKDGNTYDKIIHYFLLKLRYVPQTPNPQLEADENFENAWVTPEQAKSLLVHEDAQKALGLAMSTIK